LIKDLHTPFGYAEPLQQIGGRLHGLAACFAEPTDQPRIYDSL
jgi:hypothetical protein